MLTCSNCYVTNSSKLKLEFPSSSARAIVFSNCVCVRSLFFARLLPWKCVDINMMRWTSTKRQEMEVLMLHSHHNMWPMLYGSMCSRTFFHSLSLSVLFQCYICRALTVYICHRFERGSHNHELRSRNRRRHKNKANERIALPQCLIHIE